jgi:hypothetical protein
VVYTIGKAVSHAKLLGQESKSRYYNELGKLCVEDSLVELFSREWPFKQGEDVITVEPMHNDGTVTVVQGDATVTGVATAWDFANWPTPAIIRIHGSGNEEFLVGTFTSATELELDEPWPYDSDADVEYTLEFPAYTIPNYISISGVMSSNSFYTPLVATSYKHMMELRRGWITSGYPVGYAVIPGDGTTQSKIWLTPTPNSIYTVRYQYKTAIPEFLIWDFGTASCANSSVNVTGSGTHWAKSGLTLAGNIFEITDPAATAKQEYITATVQTVTNDTALVLTSQWAGRDATGSAYSISPQISMPNDMIPTFRALVESYVYARINPERAPQARAIYQAMLNDALGRYSRVKDFGKMRGVLDHQATDAERGPGMPTELILRTV